jgi:hypothetical protein
VRPGTVYVEPDLYLTTEIAAKPGIKESDENTYKLDGGLIDTITDDEVRFIEER